MPMLTQPTFGPRTALIYITAGALIDVWTLVWYFTRDHALTGSEQFWVVGLGLTGLTLIVLGLFLGQIGRAARRAELPPPEAAQAEAEIQKTAAANQPVVVAANPAGVPTLAPQPQVAQPPAAMVQPQAVRVG